MHLVVSFEESVCDSLYWKYLHYKHIMTIICSYIIMS